MKVFSSFIGVLLLATAGCAQSKTAPMNQNPLLCDPEKGICEIPQQSEDSAAATNVISDKPIRIIYFTDPICSSCWGIEPQLRKLKLEYGDSIEIDYRMGGLLPDWSYNSGGISKPSDVAHHWDEVSLYYQMPIDGDVWLEDPLSSSYPPSIAFKAAQLQNNDKAIVFLRRIREMVFLEKRNITRPEHLIAAAAEVGLDTNRFKTDMAGAAVTLFQQDLELAKQMGVRGFPTLFFVNEKQEQQTVYGFKPYETFEQTVRRLVPGIPKKTVAADLNVLLKHFNSLTAKEYAILAGISMEEATRQLDASPLLKKTTTKNGAIWHKRL